MVARTLWLWLSVGWLMTWLTEAVPNPNPPSSICDLGPCKCTRGQLICDCTGSSIQDVILRDEVLDIYSFSTITVTNCARVHVSSQALSNLAALQQVNFANIARLNLEQQAFSWTTNNEKHNGLGLLVNITNCAIPDIPSYCFRGYLRDILLTSVAVNRLHEYAFSSINHADKISFHRVNFRNVMTQAFKKCGAEFFTFRDCKIPSLPERTITDLEVYQEARFENVNIDRIETSAFKINGAKNFRLIQSRVGHIESEAFEVNAKGDVSIHENMFNHVERNAFLGLTMDWKYLQEAGSQDLLFENNTIVTFENASLTFNTSGLTPRLDRIIINKTCSCASADSWTTELLFYTQNGNSMTSVPQANTIMFCLNPKPTSVRDFQRFNCSVTKSSLLVKVLIAVVICLALFVISIPLFCGFKRKAKRYINVPTDPADLKPADTNKAHMLVVPDGKTYRETELHVIVEHVEPIVQTEYVKERPDRNGNG